jgi:DNA-binding CsgD family transcriptional regulator
MSGGPSTAIRSLLSKYTIASAAGDDAGHAISIGFTMEARMKSVMAKPVEQGREAYGGQRWSEAYRLLSLANDLAPLEVPDLELLAVSAYLTGNDAISNDLWVRGYNECLRLHDIPRAARCVFWLALDLLATGEIARAGGWLTRTLRLLDDGKYDCPERGLVLVLIGRLHAIRGDAQLAYAFARQAVAISDRFDDPDLKAFGGLILGQTKVRIGEAAEAATLFDELIVAVTVDNVSPITVGVLYCAVIEACHHIYDIPRAREWTAALSHWCTSQPDLVPFRGQCIVHRAELMRLSGAWSQALFEAEHACAWFTSVAAKRAAGTGEDDLPVFKYPVGAAFYELAEIHRVRGDSTKAETAYREASRCGKSPEPGLALLRMGQGKLRAAEAAIRRLLGESQGSLTRASVLAAAVDILIAVRDLPAARAAAGELAAMAASSDTAFLRALSAQATGSVLLAEDEAYQALATLRVAWMTWQELEAPHASACVRVLMGLACRRLGDDDAAELEWDAARRVFERLAARPDLARLNSLIRTEAGRDSGALTRRERQVIELVAAGKTNRIIAQELAISERTVDRHVSNILMKLELPSRSAATAYAYERGLV